MAVTKITGAGLGLPNADGNALGGASNEWSDLYLADSSVIYFGNDQDVTLTHVADTGILLSSTDQLQFGDSGTYIHQSADGVLDLVSDTEIEINATTIDVNGTTNFSGAITPAASDGAALGTTSLEWSDLYLADGAVLGFGDDQDVTLTHVADTGLLLNSTMAIQFNDASQYINAPSNAILDINATDEIELNATLVDINANVEISGTATTTGVHTFTAVPVFPNNTVETADIQDNAVTLAKMAGGTDGNIISYDASGDPVAIATGNDGQVLTSTGAGSPPAFEDAAGGSWSVLSSHDFTSSNATTCTLTGIDGGNHHKYAVYMAGLDSASDFTLTYRMGTATAIHSSGDYYVHVANCGTNSTNYDAVTDTNQAQGKVTPSTVSAGYEGLTALFFLSMAEASGSPTFAGTITVPSGGNLWGGHYVSSLQSGNTWTRFQLNCNQTLNKGHVTLYKISDT